MPPGRVSQRQSDRRSATRPVEGARGGGASYEREDRPARQRTAVPQRMYGRPAPSTSAAGGRRSETQQGSAIGSHRGRGRRTAEEDDADVSRDRRNDISAEIDDEDEEGGEDADEDADADADDDDDNATAHADGDAWKVALMGKPKLKTTERAKKAALALGKDVSQRWVCSGVRSLLETPPPGTDTLPPTGSQGPRKRPCPLRALCRASPYACPPR